MLEQHILRRCENPNCLSSVPEFYKNRNNPDGLDKRCKLCKKEEKNKVPATKRSQVGSMALAQEIRRLWCNSNISYRELCTKYGFDVYNIIRNKNWHDPNYIRPDKKMGRKRGRR